MDEEELEYQLEQAARAAGLEFRPESWKQQLFLLLDEPNSSGCAGLIGYVIMAMIATSSVCLVIETHPAMGKCTEEAFSALVGFTSVDDCCSHWDTTHQEAQVWADRIHWIESVVVCSFTVELFLRLMLCRHRPRKNRSFAAYVRRPLILVDFLSVVPWWVERAAGGRSGMAILRMLRLGRLFRLLKAAKFVKELQFFVWAFYRAREGLYLLLFLVSMYVICFGAVRLSLLCADHSIGRLWSNCCTQRLRFCICWNTTSRVKHVFRKQASQNAGPVAANWGKWLLTGTWRSSLDLIAITVEGISGIAQHSPIMDPQSQ